MFLDGALAFREFAMNEPLPLARIHDFVLRFLQGRDDATLSAWAALVDLTLSTDFDDLDGP